MGNLWSQKNQQPLVTMPTPNCVFFKVAQQILLRRRRVLLQTLGNWIGDERGHIGRDHVDPGKSILDIFAIYINLGSNGFEASRNSCKNLAEPWHSGNRTHFHAISQNNSSKIKMSRIDFPGFT